MSNIYDVNGHLTQFTLESLKEGTLPEIELIQAVSHMADCESCANAYADSFIQVSFPMSLWLCR